MSPLSDSTNEIDQLSRHFRTARPLRKKVWSERFGPRTVGPSCTFGLTILRWQGMQYGVPSKPFGHLACTLQAHYLHWRLEGTFLIYAILLSVGSTTATLMINPRHAEGQCAVCSCTQLECPIWPCPQNCDLPSGCGYVIYANSSTSLPVASWKVLQPCGRTAWSACANRMTLRQT